MAELADALDSGSSPDCQGGGSSPFYRTKNGKSRYMALLTEIVEEDTAIILERIMQNWKKDEHGACEVSYELDMIRDGK